VQSLLTFKVAWKDLIYQIYFIGVKSQSVVLITRRIHRHGFCVAQTYFPVSQGEDDTATLAVVGCFDVW